MDTRSNSEKSFKIIALSDILIYIENSIRQIQPDVDNKKLRQVQKEIFKERVLSTFSCEKNTDIINFLSEKAVDYERHHLSRTFFFARTQNGEITDEWLGFFVLNLRMLDMRDWDKKVRKQVLCTGKSPNNTLFIPTYLIAQLAKNDRFSSEISGKDMMSAILKKLHEVRRILGGKIVWLDSINTEKVIQFYEQFGFKKIGSSFGQAQSLQPMFLIFPDD